jgi:predicted ester cyclase
MRKSIWMFVLALSACTLMLATSANAKNIHGEGIDSTVIDRWLEMYNRADVSQADEILTPDFIPHMPGNLGIVDRASYLAKIVTPGVLYAHMTIQDLFGEGNTMVGRFTITAVWPPSRPYTNTAIVFFRFENSRIAEEWWELDFMGVLEQVGQLPRTRPTYEWSAPSLGTGYPWIPQFNAGLVRYAVQAVNTENYVHLHHILSADYKNHDVVAPYAFNRATFEAFEKSIMHTAFPDQHITIEDIVLSGDRVAIRCSITGTQEGPFGSLPPTGRFVQWTSMTIYRIADGKIVEGWWSYNALSLMHQLTTR